MDIGDGCPQVRPPESPDAGELRRAAMFHLALHLSVPGTGSTRCCASTAISDARFEVMIM